jgi:hypothetical protein
MYQPPGNMPPPQPQNNVLKPVLIGCTVVAVLFLLLGGFAVWYVIAAAIALVGPAATDDSPTIVTQGSGNSAEQAKNRAGTRGSTPCPAHVYAPGEARDYLDAYLPASVGSLCRWRENGAMDPAPGTAFTGYGDDTNGTVNIQIADGAKFPGLALMTSLSMAPGRSDTDKGYENTTNLGDVKVHEKWENSRKSAQVVGVLGGRFIVTVNSVDVDMATAEQAFEAVDTTKRESSPPPAPKQP